MSSALSVFLFSGRVPAQKVPLFAQEQTGNQDKATLEPRIDVCHPLQAPMALSCPAKFCFDRNSGYILLLQIMSLLIWTIVSVSSGRRHISLVPHRQAVLVSLLKTLGGMFGFASE